MNEYQKLIQILVDYANTRTLPAKDVLVKQLFAAAPCKLTKDEWAAVQDILNDLSVPKGDAQSLISTARVAHDLGRVPEDIQDFVDAFIESRGYRYRLDNQFTTKTGGKVATDDVFDMLVVWTIDFNWYRSRDGLRSAYSLWQREKRIELYKQLFDSLSYDGDTREEHWDILLECVVHEDWQTDPRYMQGCKTALKTFVWRVKNKLRNPAFEDKHHVMPFFYGAQNSGKSSLMDWLLRPFDECKVESDFQMFDDQFSQSLLRHTPIIVFDEMAYASKADAEKVKRYMTSSTSMFRDPYKPATSAAIFATFIGAGNLRLSEVIKDSTGTRRFFEIVCKTKLTATELVEAVGATDFWKSVDENAKCPYLDNSDVMLDLQSQQKQLSTVENWLVDDAEIPRSWQTCGELHARFREWEKVHLPRNATNLTAFGNELQRLQSDGWAIERKKSNRIYYRVLTGDDDKMSDEDWETRGKVLDFVRRGLD